MIKHDTAIIILEQGIKDFKRDLRYGTLDVSYGHVSGTAHTFYLCDVITEEEYEHWHDAIDQAYLGVQDDE